jgi:hypothetical protein
MAAMSKGLSADSGKSPRLKVTMTSAFARRGEDVPILGVVGHAVDQ